MNQDALGMILPVPQEQRCVRAYSLPTFPGSWHPRMPQGATLLSVQYCEWQGYATAWLFTLEDEAQPLVTRKLHVYHEGGFMPLDPLRYVGTWTDPRGYVGLLFDLGEE